MREYIGLYRGKRLDNGEWVEGYLLSYEDGRARICARQTDIFCYEKDSSIIQTIAHEVDPDTVGECTSLKDLRKEVMFEHDIVTAKFKGNGARCNFKITFKEGALLFDNGCVAVPFNKIRSAVKIGNAIDNPELLKGGEGDD